MLLQLNDSIMLAFVHLIKTRAALLLLGRACRRRRNDISPAIRRSRVGRCVTWPTCDVSVLVSEAN